jgi:hypothetical protein
MKESESPRRMHALLGWAVLLALFAVDFYFDVRKRDLFSWMDPYQYFGFARGVMEGSEAFDHFEIPSIYPFFVMPLLGGGATVPGALWINVLAVPIFFYALHRLARELEFETPSPVIALLVLSSPMLVGLSRSLYVEFVLSALFALAFAFWLQFLKRMDTRSAVVFGVAFVIAFMTKLTLPVFMILPVAGAAVGHLAMKAPRSLAKVLAVAGIPIVIAIAIHVVIFAPSLGYYLTVVTTSLPFMFLMGPVDWFSWTSATYYFREIGETFLFLLTPFLGLAAWFARPAVRRFDLRQLASPRAAIWLWLLSPVLILILHPLKEPRHVAASIVPAVLLVVAGIEGISNLRMKRAALSCAVVLAGVQYLAVTQGMIETPYFLDRSLHYKELRDQMLTTDTRRLYQRSPEPVHALHWNFNQNVAIAGFASNEALSLVWQGFPGVVFDLDTFDDPDGHFDDVPYERFEDLFFLAGINSYNRRCGWHGYQATLSRDTVVAHAEILILNDESNGEILKQFPNHKHFASIAREQGTIHLLRSTTRTEPYRALYAREFLRRHPNLDKEEIKVVGIELLLTALLDGNLSLAKAIRREFGLHQDTTPPLRNIYWIAGYPKLIELTRMLDVD